MNKISINLDQLKKKAKGYKNRILEILVNWIPHSLREKKIREFLINQNAVRDNVGNVDCYWRKRIDDVIACEDNKFITRSNNAGKIKDYYIVMHNNVKVCANGYYGSGILNLLIENKGVHEPQEEKIFDEIIHLLPEKPIMLELGSYWGFYSLSLLQARSKAKCYLVEPDFNNLISGKINFELNSAQGKFYQAFVGDVQKSAMANFPYMIEIISVDSFCNDNSIDYINILHSDIQGAELLMLKGAKKMLTEKLIDYIFISTHSGELHKSCEETLCHYNYKIIVSIDMEETCSVDGLIVASKPNLI